jgi:hypothetical protein
MRRFTQLACLLALLNLLTVGVARAAEYRWTGMRNPCKQSAEDGLDTKQLGKKIGTFLKLTGGALWSQTIFNVNNKFPGSNPWVTWAVGDVRDAQSLSDEEHERCLDEMDSLGVEVFLEVSPNRNDDVSAKITEWLNKLSHHHCVKGLGVDLEFYKRVDDETAKTWDEQIKAVNSSYRLFFKHWEEGFMPPTYRGAGDLIFINTSSEATVDELNDGFAAWAKHFAPSAVAFQIGYPADEDGMDGDKTKGWFALKDPIKEWGDELLAKIGDTKQEIGLLWVCAKSGKTYNSVWDLTEGATLPDQATAAGK